VEIVLFILIKKLLPFFFCQAIRESIIHHSFEVAMKIFYVYAIWVVAHVPGAWYTISSHPLVPSDSLSYHSFCQLIIGHMAGHMADILRTTVLLL